jgi:hypothetical protein
VKKKKISDVLLATQLTRLYDHIQSFENSLGFVKAGIDEIANNVERRMQSLEKTVNNLGQVVVGQEETMMNVENIVENIETVVERQDQTLTNLGKDFEVQRDDIKRYGKGLRGLHVLQHQISGEVKEILELCTTWDKNGDEQEEKKEEIQAESTSDSEMTDSGITDSGIPDRAMTEPEALDPDTDTGRPVITDPVTADSGVFPPESAGTASTVQRSTNAPSPGLVLTSATPINSQDDAQATTLIALLPMSSPPANPTPSAAPVLPAPPAKPASGAAPPLPPPPAHSPSNAPPVVQSVSSSALLAPPAKRHGSPVVGDRKSPRLRSQSRGPSSPSGSSKRPPEDAKGGKPKRQKRNPSS